MFRHFHHPAICTRWATRSLHYFSRSLYQLKKSCQKLSDMSCGQGELTAAWSTDFSAISPNFTTVIVSLTWWHCSRRPNIVDTYNFFHLISWNAWGNCEQTQRNDSALSELKKKNRIIVLDDFSTRAVKWIRFMRCDIVELATLDNDAKCRIGKEHIKKSWMTTDS